MIFHLPRTGRSGITGHSGFFRIVCILFVALLAGNPLLAELPVADVPAYAQAAVITSGGTTIPVEVADTAEKRRLGLGQRSGLKADWGMLFVFEKKNFHRFWMKDMQFPLDIIWLDNYRIVHILENVPAASGKQPPVLRPPEVANFVLEIEAGRASELRLQVGQRLRYRF